MQQSTYTCIYPYILHVHVSTPLVMYTELGGGREAGTAEDGQSGARVFLTSASAQRESID